MAISPPRTSRHSRSLNAVNFFLDASVANDASPLTRAPGGSKPISASDSMVLPLPDSPTNPSDSPAAMRSETSFTGPHPSRRCRQLYRQATNFEQIAHAAILEMKLGK